MAQAAYDTIDSTPTELRERIKLCVGIAGRPSVTDLLTCLRRRGYRDDDVEEVALALPEDQYARVRELNRSLGPRPLPKVRRA